MSFTQKFYVADTHFGHNEVITHCKRPFADAAEMDEAMIARWNERVKPTDIVYHLGDFAVGCDVEHARAIFERLHGRKYLIIGNHDLDNRGRLHNRVRDLPWATPPVAAMETSDGGQRVYMCHYAARVWPASHHGSWHFYGHSHGRMPPLGRSRDVGVDLPDVAFAPRTLAELTAGME
jgi:calcineurin-like phosphoesterase family protein